MIFDRILMYPFVLQTDAIDQPVTTTTTTTTTNFIELVSLPLKDECKRIELIMIIVLTLSRLSRRRSSKLRRPNC
jgi:hypothetical protein